jgi:hypothetical protein
MNGLALVVEEKLHIIDEPEQQTGEFVVQVGLVFLDEPGAGHGLNNGLQRLLRLRPRLAIAKRRDGMALIRSLSGHTIGAGGAGREPFGVFNGSHDAVILS